MAIESGKPLKVTWVAIITLYLVWIISSIAGQAISPIMTKLKEMWPNTSDLEIQMLTVAPNVAAIPFIFLGGWIGTRFNNLKLLIWTCVLYTVVGAIFFFVDSMMMLIVLSFIYGIAAGFIAPLTGSFIGYMFAGKYRQKQFGFAGAVLNLFLAFSVIATGYLAKISWRLPFIFYLIPVIPLILSYSLKKYIPNSKEIHEEAAAKSAAKGKGHKVSFTQNCNMWALFRYCFFYFMITVTLASFEVFTPFLIKDSSTVGYVTSMLFVGITISGFTLNWLMKIFKHGVYFIISIAMCAGFLLVFVTSSPWIIGLGVLIGSFFYGIAQPFCNNRVAAISTPVVLTLAMAWYSSMDSFGNIFCPFVLDGIGKIFGYDCSLHPEIPFKICCLICLIMGLTILGRSLYLRARHITPDDLPPVEREEQEATAKAPAK